MQISKLKVKQQENIWAKSLWLSFQNWTKKTQLTVLVNKHAERDAVGIKSVQKILDVTANEWIKPKLLLVLDHSLGHCRNHIIVSISDFNQDLQKAAWEGNKRVVSLYVSWTNAQISQLYFGTIYLLVFLQAEPSLSSQITKNYSQETRLPSFCLKLSPESLPSEILNFLNKETECSNTFLGIH